MSWFKIFSAVVVANVVSWIIVSIIGLIFWVYVLDSTAKAIDEVMRDVGFLSVTIDSPLDNHTSDSNKTAQKLQAEFEERQREAAARRAKQEREEKERRARIASQRRTCEYWTKELREDGDADSRKYQKLACDRLQQMLRSQ